MGNITSQAVLARIQEGTTKLDDLASQFGVETKAVSNAIQKLSGKGLVTILRPGRYSITPAGTAHLASGKVLSGGAGTPRSRQRTRGLRQRAWWVLRARKSITLPDLLATLTEGHERDAQSNLNRYLRALEITGFVSASANRIPGASAHSNGFKLWVLRRNSGRQAPVVRTRSNEVFDPNTGKTYPIVSKEEVS